MDRTENKQICTDKTKVIAITGKRKTGKTQVLNTFKQVNHYLHTVTFGDEIKTQFAANLEIPLTDLYDNRKKEYYRSLMQAFSDKCHKTDRHMFIRPTLEKFGEHPVVVVGDLRFYTELEALAKYKLTIIKVTATAAARTERGYVFDPLVDEHASEMEVADISYDLLKSLYPTYEIHNDTNNDNSLSLYKQVKELYQKLFPEAH